MPPVLVTGATGFIGTHLVRRLCDAGTEVRCLVRATSKTDTLDALGVDTIVGDLLDAESLTRAVKGVDAVLHLAGEMRALDARGFTRVNTDGTERILAAAAQVQSPPPVVLVSSIAAAGPSPGGRDGVETDAPAPVSHYGRSKLAAEGAARARAGTVPVTVVRPPIVFGEGDTEVLAMFKTAVRGLHAVPGLTPRRFSVVHAADLAALLVRAAERGERMLPDGPVGSGVYYAATEPSPEYGELGRLIGEALGRRVRVVRAPGAFTWLVAGASEAFSRVTGRPTALHLDKAREGTAGEWAFSAEKARRDLDWTPEADLVTRLRQTAEWYRAQGWLPA